MVAFMVGTLLSSGPFTGKLADGWMFEAGASGGRALLTALVGGLVTALSVVFSLTITGLQTVHQQYSPRLLRNFVRDRGTKLTLGVFAGTVAYLLAVLRSMPPADSGEPVPRVAILGGMVLFMACVGVVAYFAQHITNSVRVHDVMQRVVTETRQAFDRALRTAELGVRRSAVLGPLPEPGGNALPIVAHRTGYLHDVDLDTLARVAEETGCGVRLRVAVGELVLEGTTLAFVWPLPRFAASIDTEIWGQALCSACAFGPSRSEDVDVAYGFRQLVDVAVRAMSPSLNDPYTAMQAIDHLTVLTCDIARRGVPNNVLQFADHHVLVAVPSLDLIDYVRLACDQPRRYGVQEPAVAVRLLGLIRDVATHAHPDANKALHHELERIEQHARRAAEVGADLSPVEAAADAARAAISGARSMQDASHVRM